MSKKDMSKYRKKIVTDSSDGSSVRDELSAAGRTDNKIEKMLKELGGLEKQVRHDAQELKEQQSHFENKALRCVKLAKAMAPLDASDSQIEEKAFELMDKTNTQLSELEDVYNV